MSRLSSRERGSSDALNETEWAGQKREFENVMMSRWRYPHRRNIESVSHQSSLRYDGAHVLLAAMTIFVGVFRPLVGSGQTAAPEDPLPPTSPAAADYRQPAVLVCQSNANALLGGTLGAAQGVRVVVGVFRLPPAKTAGWAEAIDSLRGVEGDLHVTRSALRTPRLGGGASGHGHRDRRHKQTCGRWRRLLDRAGKSLDPMSNWMSWRL